MSTTERAGYGTATRPPAGDTSAASGDGLDGVPTVDDGSYLALRDERVRTVHGSHVSLERSAAGRVRGGAVQLEQSATGAVLARDATIKQGAGVVVAGAKVTLEQAAGQWLVGGLIQARHVFAVTVIAGRIEGQVKCLFDARGAFAFGAGMALTSALLRLLLFRRR